LRKDRKMWLSLSKKAKKEADVDEHLGLEIICSWKRKNC
jgi:hypothetical protein